VLERVEAGVQSVKTVVFDLGNVLIRWDPRNLYRKLFTGDHERMEWFLANVCTGPWNERHDAGHPIADGVAEVIGRFPEHEALIRAFYDRWEEMLDGPIAENVAILEELKASRRPVYALTNWSAETFPKARVLFPFLGLFDGIVMSGEERVIKPDPAIYRVLLSRYGLAPEATVFVDDSEKNVIGARKVGIHAIHYGPQVDLRAELEACGAL
jgi:2-haloacid dehalogenase